MDRENKTMECVPNFSEGCDRKTIELITDTFKSAQNVSLWNHSSDQDYNRSVVTVAGEPQALKSAVIEAVGIAVQHIDLNKHTGEHPRMGAVDVIPFIPLAGCTMEDAIELSRETGQEIAARYNIPVFLYEQSATAPHRINLADIRRGGFEALDQKLLSPEWKPDYGPLHKHPTAGAVAVGARTPLIAFNVSLATDDITVARHIARKVRHSSGGLRCCKAIGIATTKGNTEVSMNLTDHRLTAIYQAYEMVKVEARGCGTTVTGSQFVGMIPLEALADVAAHYLGLKQFTPDHIIEYQLLRDTKIQNN